MNFNSTKVNDECWDLVNVPITTEFVGGPNGGGGGGSSSGQLMTDLYSSTAILTDIGICVGMSNVNLNSHNFNYLYPIMRNNNDGGCFNGNILRHKFNTPSSSSLSMQPPPQLRSPSNSSSSLRSVRRFSSVMPSSSPSPSPSSRSSSDLYINSTSRKMQFYNKNYDYKVDATTTTHNTLMSDTVHKKKISGYKVKESRDSREAREKEQQQMCGTVAAPKKKWIRHYFKGKRERRDKLCVPSY